jgi:hypothetical protein
MSSSSLAIELCPTCLYFPDCTQRIEQQDVIRSCDRYVEDPSHVQTTNEDIRGEFKGLCRYCTKRDNCTIFKPKGGVWHCEEYQ